MARTCFSLNPDESIVYTYMYINIHINIAKKQQQQSLHIFKKSSNVKVHTVEKITVALISIE